MRWGRVHAIALIAMMVSGQAFAREIKVGILAPFSGPFAVWGSQYKQAIEVFLDERGTKVGDHTVTLIYRDTASQPEIAKRLAQELITRDKVDVIAGLALTPEALVIAPVVSEGNVPTVLFNSGTHFVTRSRRCSSGSASPSTWECCRSPSGPPEKVSRPG